MRPEKIRRFDPGFGIGPGVDNENVGMGPEDLVFVYIREDVFLQVDEPV